MGTGWGLQGLRSPLDGASGERLHQSLLLGQEEKAGDESVPAMDGGAERNWMIRKEERLSRGQNPGFPAPFTRHPTHDV